MDKKGEVNLGWVLMAFMVIIVGTALITSITGNIATMTKTVTVNAQPYTAGTNGSSGVEILGRSFTGDWFVQNATDGIDSSANFTLNSSIGADGYLSNFLYTKPGSAAFNGKSVTVNFTYIPDGYAGDSGSRAFIPLILIFFAIAIAAVAIPNVRELFFNR